MYLLALIYIIPERDHLLQKSAKIQLVVLGVFPKVFSFKLYLKNLTKSSELTVFLETISNFIFIQLYLRFFYSNKTFGNYFFFILQLFFGAKFFVQ